MSGFIARALIEAATMESIQANHYDGTCYPCGCRPHPKEPHRRFILCDYHEGFDDSVHQGHHELRTEVEQLRAEVERLRAAGDALEHSLRMWQSKHPHLDLGYDALTAWEEARREQ